MTPLEFLEDLFRQERVWQQPELQFAIARSGQRPGEVRISLLMLEKGGRVKRATDLDTGLPCVVAMGDWPKREPVHSPQWGKVKPANLNQTRPHSVPILDRVRANERN